MKTLEELQVGKWYQDTSWYSKKDYAKFKEVEIGDGWDQLWYSENISDGNYTKIDNFWVFTISTLREVPLEEIQEFLPDGHPDKLVEKSLVGRYVKCLRDGANCCSVAKKYVKKGEYYKIDSIEIDSYRLKDGTYCGYIHKPDSQFKDIGFELMPEGFTPPKELRELPAHWYFKVTDENYKKFKDIRSLSRVYGYISSRPVHNLSWGYIYSSPPSNYIEISFEAFEKHVLNKESKSIKTEEPVKEVWIPKFKVGDKVRIPLSKKGNIWYKNNVSELDNYHKDYFIISGIRSNTNIGLSRADGKNFRENSFCEDDLILYVESTNEAGVPKIGDWVYAEKQKRGDYREPQHIPLFKIDFISEQTDATFLTPKESFKTNKLPTKSWY